jgi:diguanylate cyclase (GGDEF)-like protein
MAVPEQTGTPRSRVPRGIAGRAPFVLRWVVAVGASMLLGAGVEYAIASHQVEQRALEAAADDYADDLSGLELVLAADLPADARRIAARAELQDVLATHGTEYVALLEADGQPLGVAGGRLSEPDLAGVRQVVATGRPVMEHAHDAAHETGEYHVYELLLPVEAPEGTLVVEIDQRADVIAEMLADMRLRKLLGLVLGMLVGVPVSYVLGGRALHRRQRSAERTADTDPLTGLPSRRPFGPALDAAIDRPDGPEVVLALVDVDDFKQVNDRLGHSHGDTVLRAIADSFGVLRSSDVAFRIGGDEFAVVLTGSTEAQAEEALGRVRRALAERAPGVTFSAGVASAGHPARGASTGSTGSAVPAAELWEHADAALYEAKALGRRRTVRFGAMDRTTAVSAAKLDAVTALLADDSPLTVAFQPIWDLDRGGLLGHEALLRLPAGSPVDGPQEAFELAQRLGRAADLDERARRTVLAGVRGRVWEGLLFVNVHPDALPRLDVDALVDDVVAAGLLPGDLILEVTEHAGLDQPGSLDVLARARDRGFRLALDDMGQGNAGLRALTHVRFDVVKLDRGVVAKVGTDPASDATIAAATTFVQRTGGWVVAEGIEDAATLEAVLGIRLAPTTTGRIAGQGFWLGRPEAAPVAGDVALDVLAAAGQMSGAVHALC